MRRPRLQARWWLRVQTLRWSGPYAGIFVGDTATGSKAPANTTAAMQFPRVGNNGALVPVGF
eukprot:gene30749-28562_t